MRLLWDQTGERKYETGVNHGVLWVQNGGSYSSGVVWNGLTGVTESPSGAEANDMWADNMKYGSIRSAETYSSTIECYTYPKEFKKCNGQDELIPGVSLGQQKRSSFAFSYRTEVGTDSNSEEGYKIHIIYGATASPSESAYTTINDSPEAITFSYEVDTTPIDVPGFKPTASLEIDTTNLSKTQRDLNLLEEVENTLYGTENADSTLLLPDEVADILNTTPVDAEFVYADEEETIISNIILPDMTDVRNKVLRIPDGVVSIETSDFITNVNEIEAIEFPDSLMNIGGGVFNPSTSLKVLNLPGSLTSIGDRAFYNCNALTSLTIPDSVTNLSQESFFNPTYLKMLKIGNGVTAIPDRCFGRCPSLEILILPNNLESINNNFNFNSIHSKLNYVKIPKTVTSIISSFKSVRTSNTKTFVIDLTEFDSTDEDFHVPAIDRNTFDPTNMIAGALNFRFKNIETKQIFARATNWSVYADYFVVK